MWRCSGHYCRLKAMPAGIVKWLFLYAKVRKGNFWPYFGTFLIHEKSYTRGVFANPSFRYSEKRLSPHMAKFWDINLFTNRRGHEFKNAFTPTCCKFFCLSQKNYVYISIVHTKACFKLFYIFLMHGVMESLWILLNAYNLSDPFQNIS